MLEALAAARPVILTAQCNFPEVAETGSGWIAEPDPDALEAALIHALALAPDDLARAGENGRNLVRSRYSWPRIAAQMAAVYQWVLGGPKPTSVEICE
jgi:glycosyltransferase involved in cell wall biosynthesis